MKHERPVFDDAATRVGWEGGGVPHHNSSACFRVFAPGTNTEKTPRGTERKLPLVCLPADPEAFGRLVLQGKRPAAPANTVLPVQTCPLGEPGARRPRWSAAGEQPAPR